MHPQLLQISFWLYLGFSSRDFLLTCTCRVRVASRLYFMRHFAIVCLFLLQCMDRSCEPRWILVFGLMIDGHYILFSVVSPLLKPSDWTVVPGCWASTVDTRIYVGWNPLSRQQRRPFCQLYWVLVGFHSSICQTGKHLPPRWHLTRIPVFRCSWVFRNSLIALVSGSY